MSNKKIGICQKCGKLKILQHHHHKGYSEKHKDDVILYCMSCDYKAHNEARKKGNCNLKHNDVSRLSKESYHRRAYQLLRFYTE